ncbi:serine hydrolase domain-containing protein [Streptomyces diastatochromogenes]|uniref:Serine hydrolase n=1 Tax=Streptomyces diastatochromogenes TaxID=42236 RepID=A0A233S9E1_STRDA|nr:serine hydrolase domain-containing protein [Streptomyces diastatochromogenes]MCZ0991062.1 serine hydrolase [Streptomyces diastatochromogenes]OXY92283.1 serine hydrolase [Streptomyces diastatochromogenes]
MTAAQGTATTAFGTVRSEFEKALATDELGASVALDIDGELVVDLWGGHRDPERTTPWTRDTIVNVFSSTKTVTALAILVLADRGLIDLDAPVAAYWPEFAANGKEEVLVRHVMGHTSGVSGWEQPVQLTDLYDLPASTARLAAQQPWWTPGTAAGYHALSQGHLLGELVRRVDGRSLTDFVTEELAAPLGADVQIGAREQDWDRIAPLVPPPPVEFDMSTLDPTTPAFRTMTGPAPDALAANTPAWRRAEIGAGNGHTNARGLVTLMRAITLGGAAGGVRLLSDATIERIFDVQTDGPDLVNGAPMRWGMGFGLTPVDMAPYLRAGKVAWWGGWGGSIVVMDLDRRLTFSYTMNKMGGGGLTGFEQVAAFLNAAYDAL